jgi:outer membrane protein TolC
MYRNCLAVLGMVALIGLTNARARADFEIHTREKPTFKYLSPSPNSLQFPTEPSEVRIQGTVPITLQQAFELGRRNNRQLQVAQLTLERSRAALAEAEAAVYPTFNVNLENIQAASIALEEQAREALRLARLRFQAGIGTQTDIINAENDLLNAEGNRVTTILNYNRAAAGLQRAISSGQPR